MSGSITSQAVVAFSQCPRKAFFVLRGEPKGQPHELQQVFGERAAANRSSYLAAHAPRSRNARPAQELENLL